MSIETEIKVQVNAPDDFRRRMAGLRPELVSERHFEDNSLLDYPDVRLRSRSCLLRVRLTKGGALVTFKGPPEDSALFKIREELETRVESAAATLEILGHLGLQVWFRYQKYRTEYRVGAGEEDPGVHLALDETPIGVYAEFEGQQQGIREIAGRMGFAESQFLRDSYYGLYLQFCRAHGLEVGHMVFREREPGDNL